MSKQQKTHSYAASRYSKVTRFMAAFTASLFLASSQLALPAQANNLANLNRGDFSKQEWRQMRLENRALRGGSPTALPTIQSVDTGSVVSGGNVMVNTGNFNADAPIISLPVNTSVNLNNGAIIGGRGARGHNGNAGVRKEQVQQAHAAARASQAAAKAEVRVNRVADRQEKRADALSRFVTQENAGSIVKLDNGANLDLTASTANITLGDKLFSKGGFVTIEVGGEKKNVYAGSKVTAAEYIAVKQVLNGSKQSLTVNASGIATGGTVDLSQVSATKNTMRADSLTVAEGVTAVGDLDRHSTFRLNGDLNNYGSIYAVNSGNTKRGADISAENITNNAGALISSNAGSQFGNQQSSIDLSVRANQNLNNAGTIESSGDLNLSAGSINNSGSVHAAHNVNVNSNNIQNSGTMASAGGNITVDGPAALNVNNNGGTLQALEGAINVRGANYNGTFDTNVVGGDLLSKELNLQTGQGLTTVDVNKLTGTVNGSGTAAHVSANTDNLVIGSTCLTGDPVYKNAAGNIVLDGNIVVGEQLAILASGNVTSTSNCTLIQAQTGGGVGQNIVIGAGFQIAGGGGSGTDNTTPIPPATSATSNVTVFNGGVTQGGNIDFTASTGLQILANGTSGQAGGNVSLYARGNNANTLGQVLLGTDSTINTSADAFSGQTNGNITVYAGQNSASNTIQLGSLIAENANTTGGDITVRNAQPSAGGGVTFGPNGSIIAGSFSAAGTLLNSGIQIGNGTNSVVAAAGNLIVNGGGNGTSLNLGTAGSLASRGTTTVTSIGEGSTTINADSIAAYGSDLTVTAGGSVNITAPSGIVTSPFSTGNGGNVIIKADTNSNNVGAVNASGVNINTSATISGSAGTVAIDVNLGVGAVQSVTVGNITTLGNGGPGGDVTIRSGNNLNVGTITSTTGGDILLQTTANNGNINLGGNVIGGSLTASVNGTGVINTPAAGIDFVVDGYTVTGPVVATGQPVSISTLTAGTTIGVAGGSGTLSISTAELSSITASDLSIGNKLSGNIAVGGNINTSGIGAGAYNLFFTGNGTFSTGLFDFTIGSKNLNVGVTNSISVDGISGTTGNVTLTTSAGDITAGVISGNTIVLNALNGNANLRGNISAINQITIDAGAIQVPVFNVTLATSGGFSIIDLNTTNSAVPLVLGTSVQQLQLSAPGAGSLVDLNIAGTINVTTTGGFTTDNIVMTTTGAGSDIIFNGNVTGNNSFTITSADQIQLGATVTGSNGLTGTAGGDILGNGTFVATDLDLTSTGGNIGTSTSARIHGQTTGTVTLSAAGNIFYTDTANLTLGDSSAGVGSTMDIVADQDLTFLANSTYGGGTQVFRAANGAIFLQDNTTFNAANSVSLRSFASIVNANIGDTATFNTPQLNLTTDAGNIGVSSAVRLEILASSLSANAPLGNVWISTDAITIGGPTSAAQGTFDIQVNNGNLTTSSSITSTNLVLTSTLGSIFVNSSVTGTNSATLTSAIDITGTGQVNGSTMSLTATAGTIGTSAGSRLNIDADTLSTTAGTNVFIFDVDTLDLGTSTAAGTFDVIAQGDLSTSNTITVPVISLQSVTGDLNLNGNLNATTSVTLDAFDTINQNGGTIVTPSLTILNADATITQTNNAGNDQAIQVLFGGDVVITTQETGNVSLLSSTADSLTLNASQAVDVTTLGNTVVANTLDITAVRLNHTFGLTADTINVQSPTGNLTIDGGFGLGGNYTAPNGINLTATSGDLIFIGNTNFFGVADLYSNPNPPFGAIVVSNNANVIGNLAVNLHTCLLDIQGNGVINGNPLNFLCPTGAGTIANTSGDVNLTALGPINFFGKDLAIIASGNINATGPLAINLSNSTSGGLGGDLVMIAGYNWTPSTGGQLNYTPIVFTLTGPSAGGSINLSTASINTSGDGAAGNITAVAQNGTVNLGTINASSANGVGGFINVIGQNGVTVGDIATNGPTTDGTVNLAVSNPAITGTVRVGNGILFNGSFANSGPNSSGNLALAGINAGATGVVNLVGSAILGNTIVQSGNPLIANIVNINAGAGDVTINNGQFNILNSAVTGNSHVTITNSVNLDVNNVTGAFQELKISNGQSINVLNSFTIQRLELIAGTSGNGFINFNAAAITTNLDLLATTSGIGTINSNSTLTSQNGNVGLTTLGASDININAAVTATLGQVNVNAGRDIVDNGVITAGTTATLTAARDTYINSDITAGGDITLTATTGVFSTANNVDLLSSGGRVIINGNTAVSIGASGNTITANGDVTITSLAGSISSPGTVISNTGDITFTSSTFTDVVGDVTATAGDITVAAGTEANIYSDVLANQNVGITGTNINLFSPGTVTATNGQALLQASDSIVVGGDVTAGTDAVLTAVNTLHFSTSVDVTGGTSVFLNSDNESITGTAGIVLNLIGGVLVTTDATDINIRSAVINIAANTTNGIVSVADIDVSGGGAPNTPTQNGGNAGSITISADTTITTGSLLAYGGGGSGGSGFGEGGGDGGDGGNISVTSVNGLVTVSGSVNTSGGGGGGQAFPSGPAGFGGNGGDAGTITISAAGPVTIDGPVLAAGGGGGAGTTNGGTWTSGLSSGGGSFGGGGGGGDGGAGGGGAFGGGGADLVTAGGGGGFTGVGAGGGSSPSGTPGAGGNGGFGGSTGGTFGQSGFDGTNQATLVGTTGNGDVGGLGGAAGAVSISGNSINVSKNVGTAFTGSGFSSSPFANLSIYGSTVTLTSTNSTTNVAGDIIGAASVSVTSNGNLDIQGNVASTGALNLTSTTGSTNVTGDIAAITGSVTVAANTALTAGGTVKAFASSVSLTSTTSTIDVTGDIAALGSITANANGNLIAGGDVQSQGSSITLTSTTGGIDVTGSVLGLTALSLTSPGNILVGGNMQSIALNINVVSSGGTVDLGGFVSAQQGVNLSADGDLSVTGSVSSLLSTVDMTSTTGPVTAGSTISGGTDVTIVSGPSFTTAGNVTATNGDVDITTDVLNNTFVISGNNVAVTSRAGNSLTIDGSASAGGTLTANTGTVDLSVGTTGDVTFIGAQTFNGTTNIDPSNGQSVIVSNGAVVTGNDTVNLNTCSLILQGNGVITGNPLNFNCPNGAGTIANSSGDVDLGALGILVFNGQSLTLLASGDILANGNTLIDLSQVGGGDAGSFTAIAGYDFTPGTGGVQTTLPNPTVYTLGAPNAAGGNIDLTGLTITTFANGGGTGGNVTLIANGDGTGATGNITTGLINSSADIGTAGKVLIIGEGSITTQQIFAIDSAGGNITIANAQPTTTGTILIANGELSGSGTFGTGTLTAGSISTSNLNVSQAGGGTGSVNLTGALTATDSISVSNTLAGTFNLNIGAGFAILANSDLTTLNVNSSAAGSVTLSAEAGALALGTISGAADLFVTSNGAITTSGPITNSGQLVLTGASVAISVPVISNSFVSLTSLTGDVTITSTGSLGGSGFKVLTAQGLGDVSLFGAVGGPDVQITTNGGDVVQDQNGIITTPLLMVTFNNAASNALLDNAANNVGTLTGVGTGSIFFDNGSVALTLGGVGATQELTASSTSSITTLNNLTTSADLNLFTPVFNNINSISAANINITSQTGSGLTIDSSAGGGANLIATAGTVNLTGTSGDVTFLGVQSLTGTTNVNPAIGSSVVIANGAAVTGVNDVNLNTCSLILQGTGTISANQLHFNCPFGAGTIANSSGDVDLSGVGLLTFDGLSLAIIASGNVIAGTQTAINLSGSNGAGGNLLVVAGFDFTPGTGGSQVDFSDDVYTFGTASASGGSINFTGLNITSNGTNGGNGGNVTLVAAAGLTNAGSIVAGNITANATGGGNGGNFRIIAEGGFNLGTLSNTGAVSGTTVLAAATPVITGGSIYVANGEQQGTGQFTFAAPTGAGTIANMVGDVDLTGLNLQFTGLNLAIIASGNVIAGTNTSIDLSNGGGAGGDLLVVAGFDFAPTTSNSQINFDHVTTYTFGAPSTSGGNINFTGLTITTNGTGADAGDVTLVAKAGGTSNGTITTGAINAIGSVGGNGGDVLVIAEGGFTIGSVTNTGTVNGSTTLAAAAPTITGGPITVLDGSQGGSGAFTFTVPTGAGTIANASGDVNISGAINFTGLSLAILAANNVIAATGTTIDLSDAAGNGGDLTVIAGYNFTPGTGGVQVVDTTNLFTIGAANANGGNVDMINADINVSGLTSAGNVLIVARGGTVSSGQLTTGDINASSTGAAGNVTLIGNDGVTTGAVVTTGATGGDVTIASAVPTASGIVTVQNGNLISGTFVPGALTGGFIGINSIDAGNTINVLAANNAGITLGNLSADQDINIVNTGSITIQANLLADNGAINITANDVAGQATLLTINDNVNITANTAISIVNTGTDRKLDRFNIGANATIATTNKGGAGNIDLRLGAVSPPLNNNRLPQSRFLVTETGGTVTLFGGKPRGLTPVNNITALGADINITNALRGRAFNFLGGVNITADPPVAAGTPTYVNGRLVGGDNERVSRSGHDVASNAIAEMTVALTSNLVSANSFDQVPNTATLLSSTITGTDTLGNAGTGLTANASATAVGTTASRTETLFGAVNQDFDGEDNSYMIGCINGPVKAAEASICSDVDLGNVGDAARIAHNDRVVLKKGNVLFVPFRNTVVETPQGNVVIEAKSVALVSVSKDKLAVYDFEDSHKGAVSVEAHGQKVTLAPGNHLTVASAKSGEFAQVNAIEAIPHRNVATKVINNGAKLHSSEFSVVSAIQIVKPLHAVMNSKHPQAKKVAERMMKTTAVLLTLGGKGEFQHFFKPAVTAMK